MEMPRAHPRWGIEFDWLAVDSRGQVALFTSAGYGAVPEAVLRNVPGVDEASQAIAAEAAWHLMNTFQERT